MIPQHIKNFFINELEDGKIVLPSLNVTFKFHLVDAVSTEPFVMVLVTGRETFIVETDLSAEDAFFRAFLRLLDTLQHTHWNAIWKIFKDKPTLRIYLDKHVANKVQEATFRRRLAEQEENNAINYERSTKALLDRFNT